MDSFRLGKQDGIKPAINRSAHACNIELPYPPSVNSYWRSPRSGPCAGRVLISQRGRAYRTEVGRCVMIQRPALIKLGHRFPFTGPVSLTVYATAPDRRRRDVDNLCKAILDALGRAGVYDDDSQVKSLHVRWFGDPVKGGAVTVAIEAYRP